MTVGERIRARRLLRGWSMRYAASRAGVSHATWSRIERGRQPGADVEELPDAALAGQVPDGAGEERAVAPDALGDLG